jgi:CelD/BcsL family acetyltransferase involved in cellulose biosynthesis
MDNLRAVSVLPKRAGSYRATLHDDLQDPEIRQAWQDFERSSGLTAFQKLSFVENLFNRLAHDQNVEPTIAAVRDDSGAIIMLMAFVRRQYLGLTLIEHVDFDMTDYAAPLTAPDRIFDASDMARIQSSIIDAMRPADAVVIKKICPTVHDQDNPFALLPDLQPMNATCTSVQFTPSNSGSGNKPPKRSGVSDANRKWRRLSKIGAAEFRLATTSDELSAALDAMIAQRTARFEELQRPDILRDPKVVDFYKSLAHRGLQDGSVRVFSLNLDGQSLAVVYALEHKNTLSVVIPSMVSGESWKPYSPGLIAIAKSFEWAEARGMSHYDFGVGGLGYKSRFQGTEKQLYEVFWPLTLRGQLAASQANLKRIYRGLGRRFPAIDARVRRTLGK